MKKITEKMNNNYCVYMHIFPNNKKYIGITSLKPKYRWSDGKGYKKQKLMYRAILKYGWENIKHEILYTNLSETEAKKKEIELIEKYKSNDENYGYNQTLGGDGTLGLKLSQERKEKLSKLHLGIPRSQETKRKISESEKGKIITKEQIEKRKATMKKRYPNGFKQSDEIKNKISIRMLNNKYNVGIQRNKSYTDKISIKVMCVETGEIFNSVIEASRKKNINKSNLHYTVCGKRKTAGGYHWKRVDEYEKCG